MIEHRGAVLQLIENLTHAEVTKEDLNNKDCQRLYRSVSVKANTDKLVHEKEAKKKKDKELKRQKIKEKYSIQKPVYENCRILAPDGEILCKCDRKKVEWYLSKNLATKLEDDPLVIQLNFEPNGRGISSYKGDSTSDNQYYVEYKKNQ